MVGGFGAGIAGGATVAIVIKAVDQFSRTLTKAQKQMAAVGTAMVAVGAAGVFAMNKAVESASNLQESINAVEVVFGKGAKTILEFGKTAAKSVGLATSEFNQMSAVTGALLKDVGLSMEEAAKLTNDLTIRASDLASVFNTDVSDAMSAINQALRGETEAIRRFAGDVTDATLEMFLLSKGINKSVTELTQQEKRLFRVQLIMEQTANVAGDFANTSDSLANRQRILAASFEDTKAKLGDGLLPVMETLVGTLQGITNAFSELDESTQSTIGIIIAVTAVVFILTGALALATVAAAALGIALLPLTLIVFGIIAAITLIILIFKNWDVVVLALKNTFISFANITILVWNKIVSVIEDKINRVVKKINFLIKAMNKIPGVSIPLIPDLDLGRFKADLLKFDFGVQEVTKTVQKQAEAIKQVSKEQELVNKLQGFKVIQKTGDIFNPNAFQKKDFQSDFAFTQAKRGAGFTVNIENVVGLDPEEISQALSSELNNKVSL